MRKKDEGFTNIRIKIRTREELRAIGTYNENMDDIVRKCLAAYKELERLERGQKLPQQQPHPTNTNTAKEVMDNYAYSLSIPLPEMKYPISKEEMVQQVSDFHNKFIIKYKKAPLKVTQAVFLISSLPNSKVYRNETELNLDLDILVNNKEILEKILSASATTRIRGCRIKYTVPVAELSDSIMESMFKGDEEKRQRYYIEGKELQP
jgi:hypothetical protein